MDKLLYEIKNDMYKKESRLNEYACKSNMGVRKEKETDDDIRPNFFRDIDRIIHTHSYTRYMDKTQVFSQIQNDHVSRRMLHVQLVSKIARTIGRYLNLNEDLIEASSLGHDVGHVPYGHVGERILNDISIREGEGFFSHNIQSARTFMFLENNGQGCNLTLQTLDGIMCHNGEFTQNVYEPFYKKNWDIFLEEYYNSYNSKEILKNLRPMTLEGCVTRISDIIGYIGRDIEDAIQMKIFSRDELPDSIISILGSNNKDIVNELILDIIKNSYGKSYISISPKVYNALVDLKKFNYEHIYYPAITEEQRQSFNIMINKLYYSYLEDLNNNSNRTDINKFLSKMSKEYLEKNNNKRKVIDYIAGMTDSFLETQYEKLK